jgi:CheY-like chemotaxis protein
LLVRDAGKGIDPRFLPHVFDRFRQADSSYTREHGGLGLGLAVVKSIVELHGGTVAASSSGPGFGAAFRVTLPSGVPRLSSAVHPAGAARRLDGVRILVVDDQPDERELFSTILGSAGADVRTAGSMDEAIDRLSAWEPTVMVTDLAMPGGDGYMLLRRVRAMPAFERLPVVAVTAHARSEDRDRAEAAGFDAYLSKPIDPERLIGVLAGFPMAEPGRPAGETPAPADGH